MLICDRFMVFVGTLRHNRTVGCFRRFLTDDAGSNMQVQLQQTDVSV